jgi:fatty acid desaturase
MCEIGPFSQRQKLIVMIGVSALTVGAFVMFITFLATGSSEWPFYALCVLAGIFLTDRIRRAPIKDSQQ